MDPKAFISYSWTTQEHQDRVREWAERLLADGVDVVLDQFDLKEGQDKYAFMERMVTDDQVTHVLVVSDKAYANKADSRKKGVGTESQIISKEVYDKVDQSKFIPIACEFDEEESPFLPTFFKTRIWIDFSTPEAVNENWERLIRLLFGQPLNKKPDVGKPPAYLAEESSSPANPARGKFDILRQAILQGKHGIDLYRRDFIDSCIEFADKLRVRQQPNVESVGEMILDDCTKLVTVRDHLVDWVLLESRAARTGEFSEALIETLERLRELKSRPAEVTQWNDSWFEAHDVFVYETFLYLIAALLETRDFENLHEIFSTHYLMPTTGRYGDGQPFERFDAFYGSSQHLGPVLSKGDRKYYSPAAELIKRQANRDDISFDNVMQADLLALLMAFITPDTRWYPQTMHYAEWNVHFPFFLRASQHKNFAKLAIITGVPTADALRELVKKGHERLNVENWYNFHHERNFWNVMNMDGLDTLK